jgi:lipopolysaccharide export system permease protein
VKEDVLQPVAGIWMATFILLPVGIFFVYKAMNDSQLMNKEFYYRFFRKLRTNITRKRRQPASPPINQV